MRFILADLRKGPGLLSKDTVAGGYGSRLIPFSRATGLYCFFKNLFHNMPSIQLAYVAAILLQHGHEVVWTDGNLPDGDQALVLSSLVDYRCETAWARALRKRGVRVGFLGLAASKLPELFAQDADFLVMGEPESAARRLASGESLAGMCLSEPIADLDSLPFPRWPYEEKRQRMWRWSGLSIRPLGGGFPVLASRSCTESCTYCPHRILASYRARSPQNIAEELQHLCKRYGRPYIVFRDPLFTQDRDRCLALCQEIQARGLRLQFECETRLDYLDAGLLNELHRAGMRVLAFGVEAISAETLHKVARRAIMPAHQRAILEACRQLGILTAAYYVFGFLQDTWESIAATIEYATSLRTTFAQFKLLTPYPGTPLWKQMKPLVREDDWQKFDGYTPTFAHPNLSSDELRFLLGAAYAHFYSRPSWLSNYLRIERPGIQRWIRQLDLKTLDAHTRKELSLASRAVTC